MHESREQKEYGEKKGFDFNENGSSWNKSPIL